MTNKQIAAKLVAEELQTLVSSGTLGFPTGAKVAKLAGQSKLTQKRLDAIVGYAKDLVVPFIAKMAKKALPRPPRAAKGETLDPPDEKLEMAALNVDNALTDCIPDVATSQVPEEVPF